VTGIDTPQGLLEAMRQLRSDVLANTEEIFGAWQPAITRPGFSASARNLACYLALRRPARADALGPLVARTL
jgi:hypothetical protein